jgi:hypothetical protein
MFARNNSTLNKEFVKISSIDSTFVSRSMKLHVALLTLQESDQLIQRMRSLYA